ncbi:hypothetical protein DES53_115114 [Roseimicrobium gellanilyticum]|uniref:Uncharacterized protein n=1 Tax=Roseimicrobium gellanilyticum TaxID=748857 RepID=A0A366H4N8_9BACT|nr:hypothetical protein [Roseimicrobium gellanilyticum]RBP36973.1 hypothetical protein DES53_115114 [Roseimicrobium gellanilyticum]
MSRRAKVILFVVTAAVIALWMGYVGLSWSAERPLRFHVIARVPEEQSDEAGASRTPELEAVAFDLDVQNTQPFPIHLGHLRLIAPRNPKNSDPFAAGDLDRKTVISIQDLCTVSNHARPLPPPIPAYGVMRVRMWTAPGVAHQFRDDELSMLYVWISATKGRAYRISYWIRERLNWVYRFTFMSAGFELDYADLEAPAPGDAKGATAK